ncbi:MAG: hypothetical protein IPP17_18500 [Bacteroidetes bacterium]|nr:hypothetical protein [Bacteroidota bacterium]
MGFIYRFWNSGFGSFVDEFWPTVGNFLFTAMARSPGFLPKGMPILGEEGSRNLKFGTILVSSIICVINFALLCLALCTIVYDVIPFDTEKLTGPFFAMISFIALFLILLYAIHWFDSLNQIAYFQSLPRALIAISGPPAIAVLLFLLESSFAGGSILGEFETGQPGFFSIVVVFWCGAILIWSLIPWLYVLILNKSYRQALRENEEIEALKHDAAPTEQMEGSADWFEPLKNLRKDIESFQSRE